MAQSTSPRSISRQFRGRPGAGIARFFGLKQVDVSLALTFMAVPRFSAMVQVRPAASVNVLQPNLHPFIEDREPRPSETVTPSSSGSLRLKLAMEKSPSGPSVPEADRSPVSNRQADRPGGQKCVLDRLEAGIARLPEHLELGGAFAQGLKWLPASPGWRG